MNKTKSHKSAPLEAVVGVFGNRQLAQKAAAAMREEGIDFKSVRLSDDKSALGALNLHFEDLSDVGPDDIADGIRVGGGIGAAAGLVFMAIPGLGFAAPIAGMLCGALIGGMAGIDEKVRAIELPAPNDYRTMLQEGKSLMAIHGTESDRLKYAAKLETLGAISVYQHPPASELVRQASVTDDA